MSRVFNLTIVSDIHYASAPEQARGDDYESAGIKNPFLRGLLKIYRRYFWLHLPLRQNHLLEKFLAQAPPSDFVIANGDYSCDTKFIGVSDAAACQSANEALTKLRGRFGQKFRACFGDHELGKCSLAGGLGGMRLASFHCAQNELKLEPFWRMELGRYVLIGVTSSLIALPVFEADALPDEFPEWQKLRDEHLAQIRAAFSALKSEQRVILFCHDPTALPFLWQEEMVRAKTSQIEQTVIGHLHSNLIFWKSRVLAGMPVIPFLGHSVRRMSKALRRAKYWKPFHARLCPSLSGIELLKDGGFLTAELDEDARTPVKFQTYRIKR